MPKTSIEWCDYSWPVINGCRRESRGCENCYAERLAATRLRHTKRYSGLAVYENGSPRWTGESRIDASELEKPLRMRKPQTIFVCEMGDLFYERNTNEQIASVFGVMAASQRHRFIILTKRARRMREWFEWVGSRRPVVNGYQCSDALAPMTVVLRAAMAEQELAVGTKRVGVTEELRLRIDDGWPLPNVILGVSCEDQKTADERIPELLRTPAAMRVASLEPLLALVDLGPWLIDDLHRIGRAERMELDWVIVGGESGPRARPYDVAWPRSIIQQCRDAGVPVFHKQLGANPGMSLLDIGKLEHWPPRDRKGGDPSEWPEGLRVRECPI